MSRLTRMLAERNLLGSLSCSNEMVTRVLLASFSALLVATFFVLQFQYELDLADEGFLWFGSQRVLASEIPQRDFQSYDPGRYFLSGIVMSLLGSDGIYAQRIAIAVTQFFGLYLILLLVLRNLVTKNWIYLILTVLTILVWMHPRHKMFDITVSIMVVFSLTLMIEKPVNGRIFLVGVVTGLAAFIGKNHGLYGVIGGLIALAYLVTGPNNVKLQRVLMYYMLGIAVGFSPMLLMMLFVSGFPEAYWNSIIRIVERGSTNLTLPVVLPWELITSNFDWLTLKKFITSLFLFSIPVFGALGLILSFKQKLKGEPINAAVIAAAAMAVPLTHFAFSRADISHIAQSIFPLLIGMAVIGSRLSKTPSLLLIGGLSASSLMVSLERQPGWTCRTTDQCSWTAVNGEVLMVKDYTLREIAVIEELIQSYGVNRSFLVVPNSPGLYAIHRRQSPTWEVYFLFQQTKKIQREEINRIEMVRPAFILVKGHFLDGIKKRSFSATHEVLSDYLSSNYNLIENAELDSNWDIYVPDQ